MRTRAAFASFLVQVLDRSLWSAALGPVFVRGGWRGVQLSVLELTV